MKPDMFKEPVSILVGLGFPMQVRSVTEAYRYLVEWPARSRGAAHSIALDACRAALLGEVDAETARGLFAAPEWKSQAPRRTSWLAGER